MITKHRMYIIFVFCFCSFSFSALGQNPFFNRLKNNTTTIFNKKNVDSFLFSSISYDESHFVVDYISSTDSSTTCGTIGGGNFLPGYFFIAKENWVAIFCCEQPIHNSKELILNSNYISFFDLRSCNTYGTFTSKCNCFKGDSTIVTSRIKKKGKFLYATRYYLPIKLTELSFNQSFLDITTQIEKYFALLKAQQFKYKPNSNRSPLEVLLCK